MEDINNFFQFRRDGQVYVLGEKDPSEITMSFMQLKDEDDGMISQKKFEDIIEDFIRFNQ